MSQYPPAYADANSPPPTNAYPPQYPPNGQPGAYPPGN